MIAYFTYNDQPSGVYYSQVCDVVEYMNSLNDNEVRLFALVSARSWRDSRRKIKARSPKAIVWPMVPKAKNWRLNKWLLRLFHFLNRPSGYMCRGVFASVLALELPARLKVKTCFDGRGAYAAEWQEYRIIDDDTLIAEMPKLEKEAVQRCDFRLAVSNALVEHWKKEYGYEKDAHVVIPCTIAEKTIESQTITISENGDNLTLVYAGSTAGWQSFDLLDELLTPLLKEHEHLRVLFLSKEDSNNRSLQQRFPGRVEVKWLKPEEVNAAMASCDYGILLREDTVTNQVASPTKFAEYLKAGLRVLISRNIGDMSHQTLDNDLGLIWNKGDELALPKKPSPSQREASRKFCDTHFTKRIFAGSYEEILSALS